MSYSVGRVRKILIAFFVGLAYTSFGLLLSLQPAFYPNEAEMRGATPSQYGFVFGIVSLAAFLSAPVFAKHGRRIGPRFLYTTGGLAQGIGGITFGMLAFVDATMPFIGLSYLLRFIEGVSTAACVSSILGILTQIFPDHVSSVTAWTEMFSGLGYMFGPSLGSVLYTVGGFGLPFYVVGAIITVVAFALLILLPKTPTGSDYTHDDDVSTGLLDPGDKGEDAGTEGPPLTLLAVAKTFRLALPFVDNFAVYSGNGMMTALLEPHLRKEASASQFDVAMAFLAMGGVYMITTPITGYVSDRLTNPVLLSIAGDLIMLFIFVFIGPLPIIPIAPTVPLIIVMAAISSVGYAFIMVASFGRAHRIARQKGYADNIATSMIISGLWAASFYFGNFVGPTASGFMVEAWGFRSTTIVFVVVFAIMAVTNTAEFRYSIRKGRRGAYGELP